MNASTSFPSSPETLLSKWKFSKKFLIISALVIGLGIVVLLAVYKLYIPNANVSIIENLTAGKPSEVQIKTEYKNPFDRPTQYVNPFQKVKSPFTNLQ